MNPLELITPEIQRVMKKWGVISIFIVVLILAFESYGQLQFGNIIKGGLWGYLFLNVSIASPLHYWKNRNNPICPTCESRLFIHDKFECPECGVLDYKKLEQQT